MPSPCHSSSSSQPHQLTGLYALGATCSTKTGQVYTSSDDAWGNVTSRTYSGTTATLTYDLLDRLIKWYVSSTNQEQYVYDANGERVLRRSTSGSTTTMTVYAFGLEEHQYSGSGTLQSNTYYYALAGRLIGALDSSGTTFYLTDALGSLLASFTNSANSAALKSNQLYGPYGNTRYTSGTLNTAKGFTGQYNDALTGLDYYGARYYDPVAGVFLSADAIAGNGSGMNPYAYVGGNPETWSDPSGLAAVSSCFATCGGSEHYPAPTVSTSPGNSLLARAVFGLLTTGNLASPPAPPQAGSPWGQALSSGLSGACLTAGCQSGIFADTGSSWAQGPALSTCLAALFGPCVPVVQPTSYRVSNSPAAMSYCTPPNGCGEGGSGESESDSAKVNDVLFLADFSEGLDQPVIDPGLLQPGEAQAAGQSAGVSELDLATEESYGGHTIARHVNVTEEFVRARTAMRGDDASAFYSLSDASESIQYVMDNNIPRMQGTGRIFEGEFTRDIGYVYDFNGNRVETNRLRVVQRPLGPDWFTLTAFPVV